MIKRYILVLIVIIVSSALVYQPVAAKEDTAQITLKKTAVSKKKLYTYTVKKGDILSTIIRHIPGITEEDISNNYQLIKELNSRVLTSIISRLDNRWFFPENPLQNQKERTQPQLLPKFLPTWENIIK